MDRVRYFLEKVPPMVQKFKILGGRYYAELKKLPGAGKMNPTGEGQVSGTQTTCHAAKISRKE